MKQMRLIYTDYLNFVASLPLNPDENLIKEKWDNCLKRWQHFCDRTMTDNTGYKPKPEDFSEFISFVMKKKGVQHVEKNNIVKPTVWQQILVFIWKILVPSMRRVFNEKINAGMSWKMAYESAKKVKLWYHPLFTNYNETQDVTTKN